MHEATKVTSQKRKDRQAAKKKGKKQTKELIAQWREKAGKKSQANALQSVAPVSSKSKKKANLKTKLSVLKKQKKKEQKKKAALEAAEAEQYAENSEWNGRVARVVGETAPDSAGGAVVLVEKGRQSDVLCVLPSTEKRWISKIDLEYPVLKKSARLSMSADQRQSAAREAIQHSGKQQQDVYQLGDLLTDDQLKAGWEEIRQRLRPGQSVQVVLPGESQAAVTSGLAPEAIQKCFAFGAGS